jgi:predicted dithiol-disulfide oxidoreductase (DUF899 family)
MERLRMQTHKVVSREEWLVARKDHLAKEKAFTRLRDQLSQQRRDLPWVKVEKTYCFHGPEGQETLSDLFAGRSQLLVYHFMFGPDWTEGCPSCSYWADNFNGIIVHLQQRDVTMVAISRAPLEQLEAYKQRMGWTFKWVSSCNTDFNYDYHVSFTPEEQATGEMYYNYQMCTFPSSEGPGISAFYRDDTSTVYHTYSCYARGLDMVNGAYHLLDLIPKGRDEASLPYSMAWLRRHDSYDD